MTVAYLGYICQVVVDRKMFKICTIIDILLFFNPRLHGVLNRDQQELGTLNLK